MIGFVILFGVLNIVAQVGANLDGLQVSQDKFSR